MIASSTVPFFRRIITLACFSIFLFGTSLLLYPFSKQIFQKLHWFAIEEIKINSEWPLTYKRIELLLPSLKGTSLLTLDPGQLVSRLKQDGWIEDVTVRRQFPNQIFLDVRTRRVSAIESSHGVFYFLDNMGHRIEKVTPSLLETLDLPVVSWGKDTDEWAREKVLSILQRFEQVFHSSFSVSQLVLEKYPFFKIYLNSPPVSIFFHLENWESQLPILQLLLHSPPKPIHGYKEINLTLPKKAVVSVDDSN